MYSNIVFIITILSHETHVTNIICKNNILCRILDLQKDRYFEMLAAKYWNQTLKTQCPNSDENEGITLESLG